MRSLDFVVPAGIDDPHRPSGGNVYDRRVIAGLRRRGWAVGEHHDTSEVPDGALAVVDGLLLRDVGAAEVHRLRLVPLIHLPLGVEDPAAREVEGELLAGAQVVVATSAWSRDWLGTHYGVDAEVVEPGVDPAPLAPGSAEGGDLLCVGALSPTKGQDLLVAALARLSGLTWSCDLVGSLEVSPAFVVHVRELADPARVRLLGPLTGPDLEDVYAAADLLVLASRTETYGMVVTEALARGIPVLATDVGGVREAMGTTRDGALPGCLVPRAEDEVVVEALAGALRGWLTDGGLREWWRAAARARRPQLTAWDRAADRFAEVLNQSGRPAVGETETTRGRRP